MLYSHSMNSKISHSLALVTGLSAGISGGVTAFSMFMDRIAQIHFEQDSQRMDEVYADTRAAIQIEVDRRQPCTEEQDAAIRDAQDWLFKEYLSLMINLDVICSDSSRALDCSIPNGGDVFDVGDDILRESIRTQVFCPSLNADGEEGVYGRSLRDADELRPGQMAIYPTAFEEGTCQVAATYIHELGHIATGAIHDDSTIAVVTSDWIYILGYQALANCEAQIGR